MTDIKIPVSAPGATESAKQIDKAADSVQNLTVKQRMLKQAGEDLKKLFQETDKALRENVRNYGNMAQVGERYRRGASSAAMDEERMLSNRAQKKLLRMLPGGNMIDDVGDMMEGAGNARLGVAFAGLVVAITAAAVAFRANTKRIEEQNKATEENIRINFKMAEAQREALKGQQDTAARGFGSMKGSLRTILNQRGAGGEDEAKQLAELGGAEAVNAFAKLLKDKNARKRLGTMDNDLMREVRNAMSDTGASAAEVLEAITKQKGGVYSRDKLYKELGGQDTETTRRMRDLTDPTELSALIEEYDRLQGRKQGIEGGRMLDRGMVLPSITRALEDTIDPMKKVIDAHNQKINEEITVRSALLIAERSWLDWWIEASPKFEALSARMGIRSTAGNATVEIKKLTGQQR